MDYLKVITDILVGLFTAGLGFAIGKSWDMLKQKVMLSVGKWFWSPSKLASQKPGRIYLFLGERGGLLSDEGEFEPLVHLEDARSVIKLKTFLENYYKEIVITTNEKVVDWNYPVISIGGPVSNSITRDLEIKDHYPLHFLDTPYTKNSKRVIGSSDHADVFSPRNDQTGALLEDVAYVVRMKSTKNPKTIMIIIAGCYGIGTYGAIDFLLSAKNMNTIKRDCGPDNLQVVIRSNISDKKVTRTSMPYHTELP